MTNQAALVEALQAIAGWEDLTSAEWDRKYPAWKARYLWRVSHHTDAGEGRDIELLAFRDLVIEIAREALAAGGQS
jgi:hypothetical protein